MEYKTISIIHRRGKEILFFLKDGESLTSENIVDVEIHYQPERLKRMDAETRSDSTDLHEYMKVQSPQK